MNNYQSPEFCKECGIEKDYWGMCPKCRRQVSLISKADTDTPIYPLPQYKVPAGQTWEGLQPDGSYVFQVQDLSPEAKRVFNENVWDLI